MTYTYFRVVERWKIHLLWQLYAYIILYDIYLSSSLENSFKCALILRSLHNFIFYNCMRFHINLNRSKTLFLNYVHILWIYDNFFSFECMNVSMKRKSTTTGNDFFFFSVKCALVSCSLFGIIMWSLYCWATGH